MDAMPRPKRPNFRPTPQALAIGAIGLVVVTATLLIGLRPGPSPSASQVAAASPTAPQSATATPASPGPTSDASWEPVVLEPIAAAASLTATAFDAAGVRPDTTFALQSLTGEPAVEIAKRLEVVPETTVRVAGGADARQATVTPAAPLTAGAVYRFILRSATGAPAGSWAFRVRGPVRVVGTLPSDQTTGVPVTTGIEVTFDQEDAANIGPFFSIQPAVTGRFERHERTQVFVPDKLKPSTTYTVTIKAGLPRTGTDLKSTQDVVFRFETEGQTASGTRWIVGRDVLEASPAAAPIIGLTAATAAESDPATAPPKSANLKVYRFGSQAAATTALTAFLAAPRWTRFSGPTLPVSGLPLAVSFTATLEPIPNADDDVVHDWAVRFPAKLSPGWYAVEVAGPPPAYAFLQVTRVSAWVSVLTDRTILWVNDVVAQRPIAGATAALVGAKPFGTSGANGILNARTPAALIPAGIDGSAATAASAAGELAAGEITTAASVSLAATVNPGGDRGAGPGPIVVVRSGPDVLLVVWDTTSQDGLYRGEWWETWNSGDETYWSLLFTDRYQYRATDTIAAWGYLRARDRDAVPASVDLRLVPQSSTSLIDAPAVASAHLKPDALGVFSVRLPLDRAALGSYTLVAVVDGRVVASQAIEVTVLHKPEYQLSVTTDHRAVIKGSKVRLAVAASFFDGTPTPGIRLRFDSDATNHAFGPTDVNGAASTSWVATLSEWGDGEGAEESWLGVSAIGPEAGDIYSNATVVVFPAAEQLDASGSVAGGRLRVTATLRGVDLAAVERQLANGTWNGEPGGKAIVGQRVSVNVVELIPVRTKVGTRYDYIEKVVVPIYHYDINRKTIRTTAIVSGAGGRIVLDTAAPDSSHQYSVRFSTQDSAGRQAVRTVVVGAPIEEYASDAVAFTLPDGTDVGGRSYRVGDEIDWSMRTNGKVLPAEAPNRYLYVVAQRGLVSVATTDSPTFKRTFRSSDAPGLFVMGVRFTGTTYAPKAASWADLDQTSRQIHVTVTPDRERYRPGDEITLRVRTTDESGAPVSAGVVLQAVDEKLYAMGAAFTPDPLWSLYRRVDSGIVRLTSTHQVPTASGPEGEGGSAGGGGARTDFRDMLAFVRLHTNGAGVATTTIKASDDLTAWHVAASALTADLRAGVGERIVNVGLPLFASVTAADEYLVSDRPSVRVRSFGLDLRPGDKVVFTVSSTSLGMAPRTITATAFSGTWVALPALRLGRQSVDVAVVAPNRKDAAGKPLSDRILVSFDVVDSRLTVAKTAYGEVGAALPGIPGARSATYTFTDAGRGRYVPVLEDLVASTSLRLDRGLAGAMARSMLIDVFGRDPSTLPPDSFDPTRYSIEELQDARWGAIEDSHVVGIDLLPYGGADPWLSARIAVADPQSGTARDLRDSLTVIRDDASLPRDLRIAAVAGLANLGAPVFADLATLRAEPDLSAFESINLGLASAALGDEVTARAIEQALLAAHGQRLGPWVRLDATADGNDGAQLTALLAILAARVGDPLAPAMLDYVRAYPSKETSHALETAATVAALLERTPAAAASFAYSVAGKRTVVKLAVGEAATISLTAAQRATLDLQPITGRVGVSVAWHEAADPGGVKVDPAIGLERNVSTAVSGDQLVTVNLVARFSSAALEGGCYSVVEQVPSGLVPLASAFGEEDSEAERDIIWPSDVVGQRVSFCFGRNHDMGFAKLRFMARVVSTGTFAWEPAVMTLEGAPEVTTLSGASSLRIRE